MAPDTTSFSNAGRSIVRHVQIKAARLGGRRANVGVNIKLAAKPSGCIIWIYFDPVAMSLREFFWFGGAPGEPLPLPADLKVGKHSKGDSTGHKAERPNIRVVPKGRFDRIETVAGVVQRLFGVVKEPVVGVDTVRKQPNKRLQPAAAGLTMSRRG